MRATLPFAALLLALAPAALPSQTAVSLQAGATTGEYTNAFEFGVRLSPARPNSIGLGFSFDAVPRPPNPLAGRADRPDRPFGCGEHRAGP
jgi:hypothetical protein